MTHSSSASSKMGFNIDDGFESGVGDDDEVNAGNGSDDFHSGEKDAFASGSESTSRGKGMAFTAALSICFVEQTILARPFSTSRSRWLPR